LSAPPPDQPHGSPGAFYVVSDCCTACGVPWDIAPTLFGFDKTKSICFLKHQPNTQAEVAQALEVIWAAELQCIRYGGDDAEILRRLVESGEEGACDQPPQPGVRRLLRNHVTFESADAPSRDAIAEDLRTWILAKNADLASYDSSEVVHHKLTNTVEHRGEVGFLYSWFGDTYYEIWIGPGESGTYRWLIRHSPVEQRGSIGLIFMLDRWLRDVKRFESIRWYTATDWRTGVERWQERPY
jgi:hypothetical protein